VSPPLKVLIAEDDPSVRMTLEFVLEDEGFEVLLAEDGQTALELALRESPDVILLDQMMPKMDGREVFQALRASESTKDTPVLVLTGMSPSEGDWGDAHFVGKPFTPDALVLRIRQVLGS
jgi:two-component system phosphate regulon response regulator PhoB